MLQNWLHRMPRLLAGHSQIFLQRSRQCRENCLRRIVGFHGSLFISCNLISTYRFVIVKWNVERIHPCTQCFVLFCFEACSLSLSLYRRTGLSIIGFGHGTHLLVVVAFFWCGWTLLQLQWQVWPSASLTFSHIHTLRKISHCANCVPSLRLGLPRLNCNPAKWIKIISMKEYFIFVSY